MDPVDFDWFNVCPCSISFFQKLCLAPLPRFPVSWHRLGLLYIRVSIPISGEQTGNELNLQPLNPTQHWSYWRPWGHQLQSGGLRRSTCLDLPSNLVLERLSLLTLLKDPPVWGSQEIITPRPAQGPNSQEANLPRSAWGFLQEDVMPQPAWVSAP